MMWGGWANSPVDEESRNKDRVYGIEYVDKEA